MKTALFGLIAVWLGGCSMMVTVPPVDQFRLTYPEVKPVPSEGGCREVLLKVNYVQSPATLQRQKMFYVDEPHRHQNAYTQSRWAQSPKNRFEEMVEQSMAEAQLFNHVVGFDSMARGEMLLEVSLNDFMQYFNADGSSYVRLVVGVTLLEQPDMRIVAAKQYDWRLEAQTPDAAGGVAALDRLASRFVLENVEWIGHVCDNALPAR